MALRSIKKILPPTPPHWVGDGFHVHPVFANMAFTKAASPFLMFDYAKPKEFPATVKKLGVGQHPHRGMETITIAFQGEVEHADSLGNSGVIGTGDVQWMTAGRGIIHEEYHSRKFAETGGTFEMCQIWLNLPKKHKMTKPRYQPLLSKDIPDVPLVDGDKTLENGYVRVFAGAFNGIKGPAHTFTPVDLWNVVLPHSGRTHMLSIPDGYRVFLFVRAGAINVMDKAVEPQGVAVLSDEGTNVEITSTKPGTSILVLAGKPIDEPIAARGPFVMNTQEELRQAMIDFHTGKFGK